MDLYFPSESRDPQIVRGAVANLATGFLLYKAYVVALACSYHKSTIKATQMCKTGLHFALCRLHFPPLLSIHSFPILNIKSNAWWQGREFILEIEPLW